VSDKDQQLVQIGFNNLTCLKLF